MLGILWVGFQFTEQVLKLSSKKLFVLAVSIQAIATGIFLLDVFSGHSYSIMSFQINSIHSLLLSPTNLFISYLGIIYVIGLFIYLIHFIIQLKQLQQLNTNTRYLHPILNEFSKVILDTMPDKLSVCYFVNSGSEANELAFMLSSEADKAVPQKLIDACAFIEDLLSEERWTGKLKKEAKLLEEVFSRKTIKDLVEEDEIR